MSIFSKKQISDIKSFFKSKGFIIKDNIQPDYSGKSISSSIYQRFWASSASPRTEPAVYIDVFHPTINPYMVIASLNYESKLGIGQQVKILSYGMHSIERNFTAAYVVRNSGAIFEYKKEDNGDQIAHLLYELCQTLNQLTECSPAFGSGGPPNVHGFISRDHLFLDNDGHLAVGGFNLAYLYRLITASNEAAELFEHDKPVNRYRFCSRRGTQKLSAELDIFSILMVAIEMLSGGSEFLDELMDITHTDQYTKKLKDFISKCKFTKLRNILTKIIELKYPTISKLVDDCPKTYTGPVISEKTIKSNITAKQASSIDKLFKDIQGIDAAWLEMLLVKLPYLKGSDRKPLLITGPTGSGKTRLARSIHKALYGSTGDFFWVNCGGLPTDNMMLSHIFGHVKGAFTGAESDHLGILGKCTQGTVFLDEIQNFTLEGQARLMQLFDKGYTFYPLGSDTPIRCTATLILATNVEPAQLVKGGRLFEDFFYRISNFMVLTLSPLEHNKEALRQAMRERWEQVKRRFSDNDDLTSISLEKDFPEAWQELLNAPLPGNFRSLNYYLQEAWFHLKLCCKKTNTIHLTAEDVRKIIAAHCAHTSQTTSAPKKKIVFKRDCRELIDYLQTAEDKKNREKAAEAIGHVRENGTGLRSRINELNNMIKQELKKKDACRRTGDFNEEEWRALADFAGVKSGK